MRSLEHATLNADERTVLDRFIVQANLGDVRVNYARKSYIGIRVGRRTWAPLWLRQDGATIYLPDPDGSRGEEPSVAFEHFEAKLREAGLSASWQPSYNAKANPVNIRLRREDLDRPVVQELLRASYNILSEGAQPWSERAPAPPAETTSEGLLVDPPSI